MNRRSKKKINNNHLTSYDLVGVFRDKVELSLIGLLNFLWTSIITLSNILFNPQKIIKEINQNSNTYVKPFTLLAISCILGSISFRHGNLESTLFFGASIIKSIESAIEITSPISLILNSLPIGIVVVITSILLASLINGQKANLKSKVTQSLCYSIGLQLTISFISSFSISVYSWFKKIQFMDLNGNTSSIIIGETESIIFYIIFFCMNMFVYLAGVPLIFQNIKISSNIKFKVIKNFMKIVFSIFISVTLIVSAKIGYQLPHIVTLFKVIDKSALGENPNLDIKSSLLSGLISTSDNNIEFTIGLLNSTNRKLIFLPNIENSPEIKFKIESMDSIKIIKLKNIKTYLKSWENNSPIIKVDPEDITLLTFLVEKLSKDESIFNELDESQIEKIRFNNQLKIQYEIDLEGLSDHYFMLSGEGYLNFK